MNFSILNWNIQGNKYYTHTHFRDIAPKLAQASEDIICIQEACEFKLQVSELVHVHAWDRKVSTQGKSDNVILSRFPIIAGGSLTLPDTQPDGNDCVAWADIAIREETVRIYNCHFEIIGVGPAGRIRRLRHILNAAAHHRGPAVICGDLNTTIPTAGVNRKIVQWFHKEPEESLVVDGRYRKEDERYYFAKVAEQAGFHEAAGISKATWCIAPLKWELFSLKLDWCLVRGMEIVKTALHQYVSDHRAIAVECAIH